jgi:hypothetical protein
MISMDLDPRLEQIVALFRSTTFSGERDAARNRGEALAQRSGMTFDEAVAFYDVDGRSIYDVFTLWRATKDDRERQALRREAEFKAKRAGQTFKDAFQADSDLRDYDAVSMEDVGEARQPGYKAAKARKIAAALAPLLERYGSIEAIIAPCERERKLLDAVRSWRKSHTPPFERWTDSVDGWADGWKEPPPHVEAAIRNAYPLPETLAEARDELRYWQRRAYELCIAAGDYVVASLGGADRLDLVAQRRREIVESLLKSGLQVRTPADLLERASLYRERENVDAEFLNRIFADLEGIVAAPVAESAQPQASVHRGHIPSSVHREQIADALGADPSRTDRSIAREFGCSPTTVGRVRADLGLKNALRSVQRGGQMFSGRYGKPEGVAA